MTESDLVLMGRASGAFGIKGEVRVFSYTRKPELFSDAGRFWAGADPRSARAFTLLGLREHKQRLVFRVLEIKTREQADELKGAWIYLARKAMPALADDEYYWFELKGVKVFDKAGVLLGRITEVMDHGAHELWTIKGEAKKECTLPVIPGVVLEMDLDQGKIVVDPPEGLLEAQGWEEPQGGDGPDETSAP